MREDEREEAEGRYGVKRHQTAKHGRGKEQNPRLEGGK